MKYQIPVEFFRSEDMVDMPKHFEDVLNSKCVFEYDKDSQIVDLYKFCRIIFTTDSVYDYDLQERFCLHLDNGKVLHPRLDMNLLMYIQNYNIDRINIEWRIGIGGGAGGMIDRIGVIRIYPNEGNHKIPHVHIYRGSYSTGDSVRFDLSTLKPFDKDLSNYNKFFSKSQREIIETILRDNQAELNEYYVDIQMGENPAPLYIEGNGKKVCIK